MSPKSVYKINKGLRYLNVIGMVIAYYIATIGIHVVFGKIHLLHPCVYGGWGTNHSFYNLCVAHYLDVGLHYSTLFWMIKRQTCNVPLEFGTIYLQIVGNGIVVFYVFHVQDFFCHNPY
jgi:hypothetical protein